MKKNLLIIVTIFSSSYLFGQNITDTVQIDEVIVTGTPVKINRNNVPMAVSVLNRDQIEQSDESALLPLLNGRVPGLFVTERGVTGFGVATGAAGQISIRGVGGSPTTGVLMLIDGHPQYMGIFGHPLPDSYVASDVEKVEVIRGPGSILYGSNAMGGVINIITKKQIEEGFNGSGRLMVGSFNTQKYRLSGGMKKQGLNVYASINHDKTDGHRANSAFKITNGYVKLGYTLNENLRFSSDLSVAQFNAQDPGPDTVNAIVGQTIDITRGYWSVSLDNEFRKISGSLKWFYNFGEHDITDGFHSNDHNYGLNLYESFKFFAGNNITLGVDYMNFGGLAENILAMNGKGVVFADTSLYELGIYSLIQQNFNEKLVFNAGIRFNKHMTYGSRWIPSGGFSYNINSEITWKGIVSKGFRSPTMRELFMWQHNTDLQPESIINYESGIHFLHPQRNFELELTGFIINGNNLILLVPGEGYKNSGKIANKGIEFSMNARFNHNFKGYLSYSYTNMEAPVYATPEHQIFANAVYTYKKMLFSLSVQHIQNLDTDSSDKVAMQDYTLMSGKTTYKLNKNMHLFVKGENLLNQKYETNRYYTMPGTTIFSGINVIL